MEQRLSRFDLTNIIVGAIVGADIYIASAFAVGLIGPFAIVVWVIAGLCATVLALVFAYCSYYVPRVGGPFAFVSEAFDDFYGFLTGWSMWIAEILALPVFAIAFVRYLEYFLPLSGAGEIAMKGFFIAALTLVNVIGVKAAGRVNDLLTAVKLLPLVLLILAGFLSLVRNPAAFADHYTPLLPLGLGNFGTSLVLVFWAYAGFELGTLPAGEVENPKSTIPKAIISGMAIVIGFYLATNVVVYGVVGWEELAQSTVPLVLVGSVLLGGIGATVMNIGALVSVSGSDESGVLGTARLSFAMAIDGLFPRVFARLHPVYGTPAAALLIQAVIAFALSLSSGITTLISFAVFNLAFSYLLTCLALIVLRNPAEPLHGQTILPAAGIGICLYLLLSTSTVDKIAGSALILLGVPLFVFFSPRTDIHHLKSLFLSEETILVRQLEKKERFLANAVRLAHRFVRRLRSPPGEF